MTRSSAIWRTLLSLLFAVTVSASSARADDASLWSSPSADAATAPSADTSADGSPFTKGQWSLDFTTSYTTPWQHGPQELFSGSIGVGYSPKEGLQNIVELSGALVNDDSGDDGVAGGLTLRTRLEVLKVKAASVFIDGSIGILESDVGIPDGGTHFNFRETAGLGIAIPLGRQMTLLGGAHLLHISNAGLGHDNPSYNGTEFYVGVSFPL